jgi:hypothetical protein
VKKKPKLSLLQQLRLPPLRLQRLRQVPLQPNLQLLEQWNRRLAQQKHLLSRPGNKIAGLIFGGLPPISAEDFFCTEVAFEESPPLRNCL